MATSPNYAWAEPDNSSLVKNGAADIRTLGDAIDTSVWNVGFGQAAKNKIINADFRINQRAFTSNTTSNLFNFDRWTQINTGGSFTVTPQTFTPGAAPVAGYEGSTYLQGITAGQSATGDRGVFRQKIESVRTFAGQTATISFWAKAATGTPKIGIELAQDFGLGGSPSAFNSVPVSAVTISTSWVRYTATVSMPSLSGKTLGTSSDSVDVFLWVSAGSDFATRASSIGIQNNTFQIWGVQVEYGSKATPFQTATGTIQGELAACQRYYQRITPTASGQNYGVGYVASNAGSILIGFPVEMRTRPTALEQSGTATDYTVLQASGATVLNAVPTFTSSTTYNIRVNFPTAGVLVDNTSAMGRSATTTAYLGWSAEL